MPVLLVFLIPVFATWFFRYAERCMDQDILKMIERQVNSETQVSSEQKAEMLAFYRAVPVSRIMAANSPEAASMQSQFEETRLRFATFRWMQRLAWFCLGTVAATFLIVGISVAFSFRSQAAQHRALRIGWPVLQIAALIQVLGQSTLAVFLSFWVTAIFFEVYVLKLILIIAVLALGGVWAMMLSIFRKVDNPKGEAAGHLLSEEEAPALWQRVRDLAARLGTAPPDRIIAGIEPSFYVTEHALILNEQTHEGRTLYLSLPMLKIMSTEEADAVLGHELTHFSGQDTLWARKISPLMMKFRLSIGAIASGISLPVAYFMHMFWKLYLLSGRRLSREREFRADASGAALTSSSAMSRALIKVCGYCEYRGKAETSVIEANRVNDDLRLAEQMEQGYPGFMKAFTGDAASVYTESPHPFDTHPPLEQRLKSLGVDTVAALCEEDLHRAVRDSWHAQIPTAQALEQGMWDERQKLIQEVHRQDLAWRTVPQTEEEVAHVRSLFPDVVFLHTRDSSPATMTYDRLQLAGWEEPLMFAAIMSATADDSSVKRKLSLDYRDAAGAVKEVNFYPADYRTEEGEGFFPLFERYYGRHKTAEQRNWK